MLRSKVGKVTVYSDRARVTRQATAEVSTEPKVFAFDGLPGWVRPRCSTYLWVFVVVTILPMAWLSGWVMERHDDGSILTPWLMHSGANFGTMVYFWLWVPTTALS